MRHTLTTHNENPEDTDLQLALADIALRYRLIVIYAFGSRADQIAEPLRDGGAEERDSGADLDIAVLPLPGHPLRASARVSLALELEDLFDVCRVDLVILPEADPFLAANIVRGARLYARDSHAADEYDLYVLRRAGDLAPLERQRMALLLGEE